MKSKPHKLSESRRWAVALVLVFTVTVLVSGCASRDARTRAGNDTSLSARLTFYTVPFR